MNPVRAQHLHILLSTLYSRKCSSLSEDDLQYMLYYLESYARNGYCGPRTYFAMKQRIEQEVRRRKH